MQQNMFTFQLGPQSYMLAFFPCLNPVLVTCSMKCGELRNEATYNVYDYCINMKDTVSEKDGVVSFREINVIGTIHLQSAIQFAEFWKC